MEEMIFVGYQYGRFKDRETGEVRAYCSAFFLSDFRGQQSEDRHFGGYKAEKLSCSSPALFDGLEPNSRVRVAFGRNNSISAIDPVA